MFEKVCVTCKELFTTEYAIANRCKDCTVAQMYRDMARYGTE